MLRRYVWGYCLTQQYVGNSKYENMSNSELEHSRVDRVLGVMEWSPWIISALLCLRVIIPLSLYFLPLPENSAQGTAFHEAFQWLYLWGPGCLAALGLVL